MTGIAERTVLRIGVFLMGAMFGIVSINLDNFFEGPCPDKFAESAARFPIPEPWFMGVTMVMCLAFGVRAIVILGRIDKTEGKSDAV
jgi:hypothetical protein